MKLMVREIGRKTVNQLEGVPPVVREVLEQMLGAKISDYEEVEREWTYVMTDKEVFTMFKFFCKWIADQPDCPIRDTDEVMTMLLTKTPPEQHKDPFKILLNTFPWFGHTLLEKRRLDGVDEA